MPASMTQPRCYQVILPDTSFGRLEEMAMDSATVWEIQISVRQRFVGARPYQRRAYRPQFQTGPIGVRVQHGPKLPPLKRLP
jgi:hypothetical protein